RRPTPSPPTMQGGENAPYTPAARINSVGEPPPAFTDILWAPGIAWGSSNSWTTGGVFSAVRTAAFTRWGPWLPHGMLVSSALSPASVAYLWKGEGLDRRPISYTR